MQQNIHQQATQPYPCKYDWLCKKRGEYNPNRYTCTHGGGVTCHTWRKRTDIEIGWYGPHER